MILDFVAGKNVGLGMFGLDGTSELSGGVRFAEFTSQSRSSIFTDPDSAHHTTGPKYRYHTFSGSLDAKRSFHGIGPTIAWSGSVPLIGTEQDGEFTLDWGANGAVLFGRQRAAGTHKTAGANYCYAGRAAFVGRTTACPLATPNALPAYQNRANIAQVSRYQRTNASNRSRMVAVPNLGGFAGISMRYTNAKFSFGYRVDEYFGAMDGGVDSRQTYDRAFYGPFAKISIGIGG